VKVSKKYTDVFTVLFWKIEEIWLGQEWVGKTEFGFIEGRKAERKLQ
jgi:hypothetical protein